jgi:transcription elongation factor Elf1
MGRNARKRAEKREEQRPHGLPGEPVEGRLETPEKCPRCGSTDLVVGRYMAGITSGTDIVCGHCNWHGMIEPGIW